MPFSWKKVSFSLLMLYDPVFTVLSLVLAFTNVDRATKLLIALVVTVSYLSFRLLLRIKAQRGVRSSFNEDYKIEKIHILPSIINPFKWDFILETKEHNIVGQINALSNNIKIKEYLKKPEEHLVEAFNNTAIGRYFSDFTPLRHIQVIEQGENTLLQAIDLRYILKNKFMHHGTILYNYRMEIIKETFHPYNQDNHIVIAQEKAA